MFVSIFYTSHLGVAEFFWGTKWVGHNLFMFMKRTPTWTFTNSNLNLHQLQPEPSPTPTWTFTNSNLNLHQLQPEPSPSISPWNFPTRPPEKVSFILRLQALLRGRRARRRVAEHRQRCVAAAPLLQAPVLEVVPRSQGVPSYGKSLQKPPYVTWVFMGEIIPKNP